MPRIREYLPRVDVAGPIQTRRATPEDAGADIGAALAGAGRQIGNFGAFLQEQEVQREISDVRAKMAKARAEWTMRLLERARTANPGDAEFVKKFSEDLNTYLSELEDGIQTRQAREVFVQLGANLAGDLTERAFSHQATLMGRKAKLDAQARIEQGRNTLLNDPTQFESVLRETEADLAAWANLSPMDREELGKFARQNLALSAVQGFIRQNPVAAKDSLAKGNWDTFLDADKKAMLIGQAEQGITALEVERRRQEAEAKAALKEAQKATGNQFVELAHQGKLTAKMVLESNLDPTGENSKEHWLNVIRTRAKEAAERPIRTSPSVFAQVLQDIRSGRITTETEIEKYYTHRGQISWDDIKELRRELQEFRTPEGERLTRVKDSFLKGMKPQIDRSNPMMGVLDHTGAEQFYNFEHYVNKRIIQAREQGKDPYALFDPASPDYLGKAVPMFQKTLQESAEDFARRQRGNRQDNQRRSSGTVSVPADDPRARRPGESPAEYLKRMGAQ